MKDIPLHDIKPLVEVPDNSFMFLIIIAVVSLLILIGLVIWAVSIYKQSKRENLRKSYLENIHQVDTDNAKEAAYEISYYGRLLAENKRELEILESLDERLSQYKYKKEVERLDDDTLGYYRLFLEVLDAS